MDYIYGKLNFEVQKVEYEGASTSTAQTTVDNEARTVSVDVLNVNINIIPITWLDLKTLRDGSLLKPGQQYRITDYVTTTAQPDTQSAGHAFDLIVIADSVNKLNEQARAIQHAGDTYFANSKLEAWQVWYSLDNDVDRFAWALDRSRGLTTSFDHGLEYIFAGFSRQVNIAAGTVELYFWRHPTYPDVGYGTWSQFPQAGDEVFSIRTDEGDYWYTEDGPGSVESFGWVEGKGVIYRLIDEFNNDAPYDFKNIKFNKEGESLYTFTDDLVGNSHNNKIGVYIYSKKATLNAITFGTNCYSNTFGSNCRSNTFGNSCYSNTFGDSCYDNTFGNYFFYNTFGNACQVNTFGNNCSYNTFGDGCNSNTFGNYCNYNTFDTNCYYNTFGNNCSFNTFGNDCISNTFGIHCRFNTFGNNCSYLQISDISATHKKNIHVENGTQGASSANKFDLYDTAILNKGYQINFKRDADGKFLMLWSDNMNDTAGLYKNNNTDATWKTIEQLVDGGTW